MATVSSAWRRQSHYFLQFLAFFLAVLLLRYPVLEYPPYWDSIVGWSAEASWLLENDFDYFALAYEQPGYGAGGPRVYFFSIYPAFQALLMGALVETDLYLIFNHLLAFCFASIALVAFHALLRHRLNPGLAVAGTVTLLAHPLFLSQADAINMEMPMLAASFAGFAFTLARRYLVGAIMVLLGFAIKPFGVLGVAALFLFHLLVPEPRNRDRRLILPLLGAGLLLLPVQLILRTGFLDDSSDTIIAPFRGSLKQVLLDLPDFLILFAGGGVFCFVAVLKAVRMARTRGTAVKNPIKCLISGDSGAGSDVLMMLFFVSFVGLYVHIVNILPRYLLYCLPPVIYFAVAGLRTLPKRNGLSWAFVVLATASFASNARGQFYQPAIGNNGFQLERTLSYMDDMRLNRRLIEHLEERYRDHTIAMSWPLVQMLTMPRLGYVNQPFHVLSTDCPCTYADVDEVGDRIPEPTETVWVYLPNSFNRRNRYYPEEDQLVSIISEGERQAYLYRRTKW